MSDHKQQTQIPVCLLLQLLSLCVQQATMYKSCHTLFFTYHIQGRNDTIINHCTVLYIASLHCTKKMHYRKKGEKKKKEKKMHYRPTLKPVTIYHKQASIEGCRLH